MHNALKKAFFPPGLAPCFLLVHKLFRTSSQKHSWVKKWRFFFFPCIFRRYTYCQFTQCWFLLQIQLKKSVDNLVKRCRLAGVSPPNPYFSIHQPRKAQTDSRDWLRSLLCMCWVTPCTSLPWAPFPPVCTERKVTYFLACNTMLDLLIFPLMISLEANKTYLL